METENKEDKIAFKDFKSAITLSEFEAVLGVARKEYNRVMDIIKARNNFLEKSKSSISQIGKEASKMPPGLADKLLDGLKRKAENELFKTYTEELSRHNEVTDFLNRFQLSEEVLPYADLTFLKKNN